MKRILLISVFLCVSFMVSFNLLNAQTYETTYTYDYAGNRTSRKTIILNLLSEDKSAYAEDIKDVEDIFGNGKITVSPNPTAGALYISFNDIELTGNTEITLYDISGRIVLNQKVKSNREELDLTNNPAGTYILIIVSGRDKIEYTVIKE